MQGYPNHPKSLTGALTPDAQSAVETAPSQISPRQLISLLEQLQNHRKDVIKSAEEWRIVFDAVTNPIFIHDKNHRVVRANKAYADLAKQKIDNVIGNYYWEVFPKRDGPFKSCLDGKEHQDSDCEELFSAQGKVFKSRSYLSPTSPSDDSHIIHVMEDITVELERKKRLHYFESMDKINRAIQTSTDVNNLMHEVLDTILNIFECDRTFLITPCNPDAQEWAIAEEVAKPGFSSQAAKGTAFSMQAAVARKMGILLQSPGQAVRFDPKSQYQVATELREQHKIQSLLSMSLHSKHNTVWEFGLVQCTYPRVWKEHEVKLFQEIGNRLSDGLATQLIHEDLQTALRIVENSSSVLFRWQSDEDWPTVCISNNFEQFFGFSTGDFISGNIRYTDMIHPDDLPEIKRTLATYKQTYHEQMLFEYRIKTKQQTIRWVKENRHAYFDKNNQVTLYESVVTDISKQKQSDFRRKHLNRILRTLTAANERILHVKDEKVLLKDMCRVIVEIGGYIMAWVGYAVDDADQTIRPIAQSGNGEEYLSSVNMSWADNELGQGPTSKAIRTGTRQVLHDIKTDPNFGPWREHALKKGYSSVLAIPLKNKDKVFGALTINAQQAHAFDNEEIRLLEELASELSYGIMNIRLGKDHHESTQRLHDSLIDTIRAVSITVEKRDPYTAGHQNRVADLCASIGQELGLSNARIEPLHLGAMIHDIGKIYIPSEILHRTGKLTEAEFGLIKSHVTVGYDIVKDIHFPWPLADMVLQHHERLDGSGYPYGLTDKQISFNAKILAVADVVEAMSSHRPYRPALNPEQALNEIKQHRGIKYDTDVVDACLRLFHEKRYNFHDPVLN